MPEVGKIHAAINAIMADCPAIAKEQRNSQQNFNYRGVDVVMNVLQPLLIKHKVYCVPKVTSSAREERQTKNGGNLIYTVMSVEYMFYSAEDGSSIGPITVQGEGMDSADKSSNKAMSVAFKYALFQIFCIPTEEMRDPDSETPPPSVPKEYKCADCGKPFSEYKDKNGKIWNSGQMYHMSEQKYSDGVARCRECGDKSGKRLQA